MRESLVQHLACPRCHADLRLDVGEREEEHVMTGTLTCSGCDHPYPVLHGVPRLLRGKLTEDVARTARSFGESWRRWSEIDEERYREQFLGWIQPLQEADFQGRLVLDAGCGKGRHLVTAHGFGSREVVGLDLSEAVEVAFANTRHLDGVHVIQGDLHCIPLHRHFDLAYCIGVLHHTPDPGVTLREITRHVRPGGRVVAWVYGRESNWWLVYLVNPLRIGVTRHLPKWMVLALSHLLTMVLWVAITCLYRPLAALGVRLSYADYMLYLHRLGFRESRVIVYDHLIAPTSYYLSREQVTQMFRTAGIDRPTLTWVNRVSWAGVGTAPEEVPVGTA
jgi:SAM-dependent methyltransferase